MLIMLALKADKITLNNYILKTKSKSSGGSCLLLGIPKCKI